MPNTLPIRIFFLNSLVIFILMACQTPHPEKKILNLEKITQSSDSFGTSPILPTQISENYSYVLFDPDSNQVLDSHQPERMSIPASTSKIPSSIAALEILGPQYRFKTSLHLKGVLRHGVLQGDLFLKGTGDPMLKTPHLMSLAQALETKGIRKITGKFYYDESYFKSQVAIEEDREPWAPYNSGLSALSVNFNQINVRWMPDALRERHFIYSTPSFPFVQFQPLFRKTSRETQFLYRDELPLDNEAMEQWLLADAEVKGGHDRLPLKNPARATAHLFTTLCEMNGLTLPVPQKKSVPADAEWITAHESPPLVEIVEGLLEYSNNVTTELVQMAAARHLVRRAVNSPESAQVLGNWTLQNILLPGIRHSGSQRCRCAGALAKWLVPARPPACHLESP